MKIQDATLKSLELQGQEICFDWKNVTFYRMKSQLVLVVSKFFLLMISEREANNVHYDWEVVLNVAGLLFAEFECAQLLY